ncbi:MAG: hypothetical protein ACFB0B_18015 [Thermonemataceae bacterium]
MAKKTASTKSKTSKSKTDTKKLVKKAAPSKVATTEVEIPSFFVPSEILRVFKNLYPEVDLERVTWSWEVPHKIYEAEFEWRRKEYEVEILTTGYHYLTEISLQPKDLPTMVKAAIKTHFAGYQMEEAEKLMYANGDVHYEVDLVKGDESFEVHVREDGYVVATGEDL